jgi:hypothetical protein
MKRLIDTPEIFEFTLVLNEVELDTLFSAVHYWKEDYPQLQMVFDKIQDCAGFRWVPEYEVEEE